MKRTHFRVVIPSVKLFLSNECKVVQSKQISRILCIEFCRIFGSKMEDELIEKSDKQQLEKKENKRNQFLSLKTKIDILNKLNDGVRPIHIANEYGIALSTISRLKKCKTSLEEAMNMYQNNGDRRSLRGTFHPKMENALHRWYLEQSGNGVQITGSMLRLKARELNKKIHENDLEFRASPGWMEKFKKRYGIRLKNSRERQPIDSIAFDFEDNDNEDVESKPEVDVKAEEVVYEPAFVTVSNLDDESAVDKNEHSSKEKTCARMMNYVEELIQWTLENDIEPLYLTMLRSLRERIRYQAKRWTSHKSAKIFHIFTWFQIESYLV